MSLLGDMRRWWYGNEPGPFVWSGTEITKREVQVYGGPNPRFNGCPTCQWMEWLSRVRQQNLFAKHRCPTAKKARALCEKQGNPLWTHYHQNFHYAVGVNPDLDTPKCICIFPEGKPRLWNRYWRNYPDSWAHVLKRQLAQACQIYVVKSPTGVNWGRYDFCFYQNSAGLPKFKRPPIPQMMYGHDMWIGPLQEHLNRLKPEILLTPYPSGWKKNFEIPQRTKVKFYFMSNSEFFSRPHLGDKRYDLLVVGAWAHPIYKPRQRLNKQLQAFKNRYSGLKVKSSHFWGSKRNHYEGPNKGTIDGERARFTNAWVRFLGSAKYVIFGPCSSPANNMVLMKYYEVLGSGAIPIIPDEPDLSYLGVKPMKHYIPLSQVWKNDAKLREYLRHYRDYKYIAENAVEWHRNNDSRLWNGFEDLVQEMTGFRYPRRLLV